MIKKFLPQTYALDTPEETRNHYDQWAASYDDEVSENGYVTPGRIADALGLHLTDQTTPILDFGCGTGLSGLALRKAGFSTLDGMDPSQEMLNGASAKGPYRSLMHIDLDDPAPIPTAGYKVIVAAGVLGSGAAPPETFDMIMNALPRRGLLAMSYNDHTLDDPAFTAKLCEWLDCGAGILLHKDYGDHLPGMNMKSEVYVIEKA